MNWDKPFWTGVLRDTDGTPSFSRTGSMIGLLAAVLWVTLSFAVHRQIPELTGPAEWVGSVTLCMYGVNRASGIFQGVKNTASDPSHT